MPPPPSDPGPTCHPGRDHYRVLGVHPAASAEEIKAAYRALVKRHHPDTGGDATTILALNAAWEVLGDGERRRRYDGTRASAGAGGEGGGSGSAPRRRRPGLDRQVLSWLEQVYEPIDRLLAQVIEPFPAEMRSLAADPYDDGLMEAFCSFLRRSRARMDQVEGLFRSRQCPAPLQGFGLSLYHCFGEVQDALAEFERYTMGYVDGYLSDGREMLREAGQRRSRLQQERRRLEV
ncbi:MAG: J domain-containing protein [Synechococcaceae cyanobacterium]|nr:J domain-containing protein [Synechococcaceae cyanobacterium]